MREFLLSVFCLFLFLPLVDTYVQLRLNAQSKEGAIPMTWPSLDKNG